MATFETKYGLGDVVFFVSDAGSMHKGTVIQVGIRRTEGLDAVVYRLTGPRVPTPVEVEEQGIADRESVIRWMRQKHVQQVWDLVGETEAKAEEAFLKAKGE